jgi:hypothetical protein
MIQISAPALARSFAEKWEEVERELDEFSRLDRMIERIVATGWADDFFSADRSCRICGRPTRRAVRLEVRRQDLVAAMSAKGIGEVEFAARAAMRELESVHRGEGYIASDEPCCPSHEPGEQLTREYLIDALAEQHGLQTVQMSLQEALELVDDRPGRAVKLCRLCGVPTSRRAAFEVIEGAGQKRMVGMALIWNVCDDHDAEELSYYFAVEEGCLVRQLKRDDE